MNTSAITDLVDIPLAIACGEQGLIVYATQPLAHLLSVTVNELRHHPLEQFIEGVTVQDWLAQCREGRSPSPKVLRLRPPAQALEVLGDQQFSDLPDGDRWVEAWGMAVQFQGEAALMLIVRDLATQTHIAHELRTRILQQEAVAWLGQQAIVAEHLNDLIEEAIALLQNTLQVDLVQVLELLPNQYTLLLRAGVGWDDGLIHHATISTRPDTQAGYTLQKQGPVIVDDLQIETRFSGAPLLHNHHIVSGITVVIPGHTGAFGVLGVHTRHHRIFSKEDANFLQAIANVLGAAIVRHHAEDNLRLMKRAIAASSNGIVITDPAHSDNPVIYVNPAFEKITGYRTDEMLGRNCRLLQGKDTNSAAKQQIRDALAKQESCHVIIKNYRKDGQPFWNELFIAPVLDAQGHLTHFIGIQSDITQHREAQERLMQEYSLLNGILQTSVTAVLVFDRSGKVVFVNDQAEKILGLPVSELMQRHHATLGWDACDRHGQPLADHDLPVARVLATGQPLVNEQLVITHASGELRYLSIHGAPLGGADASVVGVVLSIADITEQRRIEAALRESEFRLHSILNSLNDIVWSYSPTLKLLYLSEAVETVCQRSRQAFYDNPQLWSEMVYPYDQAIAQSSMHDLLTIGKTDSTYRIVRPSGEIRWIRDRAKAIYDDHGQVLRFDGISTDITDRKRAEDDLRKSEERFRLTFERAPIGMAITTPSGHFLQVNQALCQALGYTEQELLTLNANAVTHPADVVADQLMVQNLLDGDLNDFQLEKRYLHKDGHLVYAISQVALIRDRHGRPLHIINQVIDITERRRMEAQMIHDALHDVLTGLPNRVLFLDRLQQAMARAERESSRQFAVLFLDIDRFKVVNDSLGHTVGDQLLVAIAERLSDCLRPGDTLARLGGDEFAILLDNIQDTSGATHVAERIHQLLQQPFHLSGYDVFATASIGITLNGHRYSEPEALLRDADTAMYQAKEHGRGHYLLFQSNMYDHAISTLELESDLRRAIERQELRVFYQPIIDLGSGRISGFEALVRWQHSKRGLVSPNDFIPLAEETGLILPIGLWVMEEACRQLQDWRLSLPNMDRMVMSVNLSPRQFSSHQLVTHVQDVLNRTGLPADRLKLEITESGIMNHASMATELLQNLANQHIQVCIDDFGTGYSSLSRLNAFPINTLKIDRSFVHEMMHDSGNAKIVQAIVALSHALGIGVVAEGIETPEQLALLRQWGCDDGQGYWFAKPLPVQEATELLERSPQW